jgi:hypothetical protein
VSPKCWFVQAKILDSRPVETEPSVQLAAGGGLGGETCRGPAVHEEGRTYDEW